MKRTMIVVTLLMAAIVLLSGPVAEVLNLPAPIAEAKKKHKKKKKKNRPPAYNVVQCPSSPDPDAHIYECEGTPGKDYLVGGPASRSPEGTYDYIKGGEGDDLYNGGDGEDSVQDNSTTSNDRYLFPSTEFSLRANGSPGYARIQDRGGSADVLDLSSYPSTDFSRSKYLGTDLILSGPDARRILIYEFFTTRSFSSSIDYFRFSDRTITADEIKSEFP
jgi:hypothetical protein